jgi:hypothetical protein
MGQGWKDMVLIRFTGLCFIPLCGMASTRAAFEFYGAGTYIPLCMNTHLIVEKLKTLRPAKGLLALLVLIAASPLDAAVPASIRKSGDCKIQTAKVFEKEKIFRVDLSNDELELTTELRGDDLFGKFVVNANPKIKNKSGPHAERELSRGALQQSGRTRRRNRAGR